MLLLSRESDNTTDKTTDGLIAREANDKVAFLSLEKEATRPTKRQITWLIIARDGDLAILSPASSLYRRRRRDRESTLLLTARDDDKVTDKAVPAALQRCYRQRGFL